MRQGSCAAVFAVGVGAIWRWIGLSFRWGGIGGDAREGKGVEGDGVLVDVSVPCVERSCDVGVEGFRCGIGLLLQELMCQGSCAAVLAVGVGAIWWWSGVPLR